MAGLMTTEQWTITVEFGDGVSPVVVTDDELPMRRQHKELLKYLDLVVLGNKTGVFEFKSETRTITFRLDHVVSVDLQKK